MATYTKGIIIDSAVQIGNLFSGSIGVIYTNPSNCCAFLNIFLIPDILSGTGPLVLIVGSAVIFRADWSGWNIVTTNSDVDRPLGKVFRLYHIYLGPGQQIQYIFGSTATWHISITGIRYKNTM